MTVNVHYFLHTYLALLLGHAKYIVITLI